MADKKDYYETLGVNKNSTEDDLKKAYRKLAKQYHPDANPGDQNAEARFKELSEAYSVLSDPQKKAAYDQYGHAAFDGMAGGSGGFSGGFDMGDIFESFFGNDFGEIFGGGGRRRSGPRRGSDVHTNLQIKFEEAVFGTEKDIQLSMDESCGTCKGTGAKPGTVAENCRHCSGTGRERVQRQSILGIVMSEQVCSICNGEGKIIKDPCTSCRGTGKVRSNKTLKVTVPKGIDNGQSIRLSGKGEPGQKGGPNGDLLITIYVQAHKLFKRDGNNIHLEVPITFVQAALGGEIIIPTLSGEEKYTVKSGTQTGTVVTLNGKGVPNVRNNRIIGDLIVKLKVTVPTQLTDKQKLILKEFADEMGEEYKDHRKGFFDKLKDTFK